MYGNNKTLKSAYWYDIVIDMILTQPENNFISTEGHVAKVRADELSWLLLSQKKYLWKGLEPTQVCAIGDG